MIEQRFYVGQKVLFKNTYFQIISVSPVFRNERVNANTDAILYPCGNKSELINYLVVAKKSKRYLVYLQDKMESAKIVTESSMYSSSHFDLPKKKSPTKSLSLL